MTAPWPLLPSALALIGMAGVVVVVGIRLTKVADALAERTGLGDAGPSTAESSGRFARWGTQGAVTSCVAEATVIDCSANRLSTRRVIWSLTTRALRTGTTKTRRQLGPVVSAQLSVARTKTGGSTSARPTG